jgi:hypothetical protein
LQKSRDQSRGRELSSVDRREETQVPTQHCLILVQPLRSFVRQHQHRLRVL